MVKKSSKHLDIRVGTHKGDVIHVVDDNGTGGDPTTLPKNADLKIEIFWAENSPG
jgi:hypothetical protein